MKTCTGCNKSKAEDEYAPQRGKCKKCYAEYHKKYYENNREKRLVQQKRWNQKNPEKMNAAQKRYRAKNPDYDKQWKKKNPKKLKLHSETQMAKPSYKIQRRLYNNFKRWFFKGAKSPRTERLVGCILQVCILWIEAQFLPGMTWENYGAWHIDHMLPWEYFNLFDEGTHSKVMHYTNLQPLWGPDNIAKHSKIIYDMEWRDTWYIHTGTEYVCRKIQVENKINISVKPIVDSFQGFAHTFMTN